MAILHAENKGKLYTGPKDDLEDPLDALPHVCAAFPRGVWSLEMINNRVYIRGLGKDPKYHRRVV